MEMAVQLMMGVSLAACAGLRAWLPLLCVGLLARTGYVSLGPSFEFLTGNALLIVLGVATVLELLGDKIVAIDNVLDAIGTVARPVAGTLLTASVITNTDPLYSVILGLILGGGAALTVHTGKAVVRAKSTATAPLHAGVGNFALSVGEDIASLGGIGLAVWLPILAFAFALVLILLCVLAIRAALHHGRRLLATLFRSRPAPAAPPEV